MTVKAFKLMNGFDVIVEVVKENLWKEPMLAQSKPTPDNKMQVSLTPLAPLSDNHQVQANEGLVLMEYTPKKEFIDLYNQTVNAHQMQRSNLVAPSANDIQKYQGREY